LPPDRTQGVPIAIGISRGISIRQEASPPAYINLKLRALTSRPRRQWVELRRRGTALGGVDYRRRNGSRWRQTGTFSRAIPTEYGFTTDTVLCQGRRVGRRVSRRVLPPLLFFKVPLCPSVYFFFLLLDFSGLFICFFLILARPTRLRDVDVRAHAKDPLSALGRL
jgi:hypothetical protein